MKLDKWLEERETFLYTKEAHDSLVVIGQCKDCVFFEAAENSRYLKSFGSEHFEGIGVCNGRSGFDDNNLGAFRPLYEATDGCRKFKPKDAPDRKVVPS